MDLMSLTVGESVGVLYSSQLGILSFFINGQKIKTPSQPCLPTSDPRHVFVDVYGPVTAVEVLPMQSHDSIVHRIGQLPSGVGRAEEVQCRYFDICRRFLCSMRCSIAGECG